MLGKQFDGTELSGGEWQKIAIARAFIREKQAQLLVLDEPTAALDPRSEYEIYNRFSELVRGKTAILVTLVIMGLKPRPLGRYNNFNYSRFSGIMLTL
ncbi:MAG: ATP-binding cassette domain-containing protein [Xenococcaceae cyanobacterium MO_167.B27]|nr:ATP-binding cassette domain-containing protein [Xenococcaceae cyanobacterium MO_167.B27]